MNVTSTASRRSQHQRLTTIVPELRSFFAAALNAENSVILWREWLTHAAAVASLHLDFHYPRYDIALDVDALDILVYSPSNQPLVGRGEAELEAIGKDVGGGQHASEAGVRTPVQRSATLERGEEVPWSTRASPRVLPSSRSWDLTGLCGAYPDDRAAQTAELISIEEIPAATGQQ